MTDCIFCKIAAGEIPTEKIFEDDNVVAFPDINPVAPVHVIIIPKRHFATTLDMSDEAPELFGSLMKAASDTARKKGIDGSGFRLIFNTNADGGQEIFHVHMHLLGGEPIGRMRER
ncbi:MAG: histidine triad nucleotide-binding protein [Candidatus Latescibacteria bacterium]|jgi:histidine triad (HIT) family protein|nr:histidine triad nucleotide-binding protein [Candidatus Latescibacterota bacterium]